MKLALLAGSTDVTVYVFIQDTTAYAVGGGLTGLVFNSAGLSCYYVRPLGNATQLNLANQTVTGAHTDGGFKEVDATNMPGVYRLDLSDAIVAASAQQAVVMLQGAANMAPVVLEIQLSNVPSNVKSLNESTTVVGNIEDDYDGTGYNKANSTIGTTTTNTDMRGTDNALLAASISLAGGAVTVGTNNDKTGYSISGTLTTLDALMAKVLKYLQLMVRKDAAIATDNATELTALNADGGSGAGSFSNQTDSEEALRDHIGDGTNLTEAGGDGDHLTEAGGTGDQLTALPDQTMNITGSLSGSVGSVAGNVTGDVQGNVDGSVGSVLGGLNTTAGVITTLDGLDTAQDAEHATTQAAIAALTDLSAADVVTALMGYFQLLARSDAAINVDRAAELALLNADEGSGVGDYDNQNDAQESIYDVMIAAFAALNDLSAAQVNAECDTALADYDGPTNAEMIARTLLAAQYGTAANQTNIEADTQDIQTRIPAALVGGAIDSSVSAIDAATANTIADHTLRRTFANAWGSADGDAQTFRSWLGAMAKLVNRVRINAGVLTVYEDDDVTPMDTQTVTTDAAADPVVELDTT